VKVIEELGIRQLIVAASTVGEKSHQLKLLLGCQRWRPNSRFPRFIACQPATLARSRQELPEFGVLDNPPGNLHILLLESFKFWRVRQLVAAKL
jgi:hypothetical protein